MDGLSGIDVAAVEVRRTVGLAVRKLRFDIVQAIGSVVAAQHDIAGVQQFALLRGAQGHSNTPVIVRRSTLGYGTEAVPRNLQPSSRKAGLRFSANAAMPSRWSCVPNSDRNSARSWRTPSINVVSNARFTACLARA